MIDRLIFLLIVAGLAYGEAEAIAWDVLNQPDSSS